MRLDLATALNWTVESEAGDHSREAEPSVIALVDRRGRRMLVPLRTRSRLGRPCSAAPASTSAIRIDSDFLSGTIH